MLTIPSGAAARPAWAALPAETRAEVAARAARFEGHPDPAVAAVAVGFIRAETEMTWRRFLTMHAGLAAFIGAAVAVTGQAPAAGMTILPFLTAGSFAAIATAAQLWRRRTLPGRAQAANLEVFLRSPAAAADAGRTTSPFWTRVAAAAAVYAAVVPASVWLCASALGMRFEFGAMRGPLTAWSAAMAVVVGFRFVVTNLHRPKHWARRVAVGEDGVRFGRPVILPWTPAVAWADVLDVTVDGPTPLRPGEPGVTVWHVRGGPAVRVALNGSRRPPEALILAARSAMGTHDHR